MSMCIGDIRHIMSAHIFDISAQSIIIRIIAASICPGRFKQYVMVSSHVMEHDMQSSTAFCMSLLIESVCRIATSISSTRRGSVRGLVLVYRSRARSTTDTRPFAGPLLRATTFRRCSYSRPTASD